MKNTLKHKQLIFNNNSRNSWQKLYALATAMKDLLEDNAGYVLIPGYRVFIVVHEYLG